MAHLKRLKIPLTWPMSRKDEKFAVTPSAGPHPKMQCMPLRVILRDVLGYADNAKEASQILNQGKVLVDKKARKDEKFPVGLMDVIEIPDAKKQFRMMTTTAGLRLQEIPEAEALSKTCKITGKTTLKKGVTQLNLHDGRNLILKKDAYKVGDSVKISLADQKVLKHLKLEKGSPCFVTAGRNIGIHGKVKDIEEKKHMLEKSTVTLDTAKGDIKTLREYIFIADTGKAAKAEPKKEKADSKKPSKEKKPSSHKKGKPSKEGKEDK
jgi:small subunit ribosomal protein S4e